MWAKLTLYILVALFVSNNALHLNAQLSSSAEISILTCRAGDDLANIFGHSAIRILDPESNKDEIYNYGIYSFSEPNFMLKFLRGKLLYFVGKQKTNNFLGVYAYEKRSVIEQKLDLNLDQKNKFYSAILENYKPENRRYLYDFFFDNCSTRIRDLFQDHLPEITFSDIPQRDISFRELLDVNNYVAPWTDFGMDLLVGAIADKKASAEDEMFLPEFLYQHLKKAKLDNRPLVKNTNLILNFEKNAASRNTIPLFTPVLFFAILLILEFFLFLNRKKNVSNKLLRFIDKTWFILLGLGSLVILVMWFLTDHSTTKWNLNLLWMSPLYIFLLFRKQKNTLFITLLVMSMIALFISPFIQKLHVATIIIIVITSFKLLRHLLNLKQEESSV